MTELPEYKRRALTELALAAVRHRDIQAAVDDAQSALDVAEEQAKRALVPVRGDREVIALSPEIVVVIQRDHNNAMRYDFTDSIITPDEPDTAQAVEHYSPPARPLDV